MAPQVATVAPEGERFCFRQDLASPHTAAPSMDYRESKVAELVPWLPPGADLSRLDIHVNRVLKRRFQGKDMSWREEVMDATVLAPSEMGSDPECSAGLQKCCKSIKGRGQQGAAHGGRISTSSLAKAWAGPGGGG